MKHDAQLAHQDFQKLFLSRDVDDVYVLLLFCASGPPIIKVSHVQHYLASLAGILFNWNCSSKWRKRPCLGWFFYLDVRPELVSVVSHWGFHP